MSDEEGGYCLVCGLSLPECQRQGLLEALEKYGKHLSWCQGYQLRKCNCGLSKILEELGE